VDMQTGVECWPEYDVCTEPSASPDNECWCDLYWENPCPCNCSGLTSDACHQAECIDDACVVVPIDCDDGNECTDDSCDPCACPNGCENTDKPDGTACDDNCGVCQGGACVDKCDAGQVCCGGTCCDEPCCGAICCATGYTCCNDTLCCPPEWTCCDSACCDPVCEICSNGVCEITCDDYDLCTIDSCVEGECVYVEIDCDDEDPCTEDSCCSDPSPEGQEGCINDDPALGCTIIPEDVSGCAGGEAELSFTICNTEVDTNGCVENYTWELVEADPPPDPPGPVFDNLPLSGSVSLAPQACTEVTPTVQISGAAEPAGVDIGLTVTSYGTDLCNTNGPIPGGCCATLPVTVELLVNLTFDSVPEADETGPGGFLCVGELQVLCIAVAGGVTQGTVELLVAGGAERIDLYEDRGGSRRVRRSMVWDVSELPKLLWVEGLAASDSPRDVELLARYTGPDGPCEDRVYLTVVQPDLDVDSDNDGSIDPDNSGTDDPIEEDAPGKILCVNDDFDEGKTDASGVPVPDYADASPVNSNGTALVLDDLIPCVRTILPEDDAVYADAVITLSVAGGAGSVRVLAVRPGATAPFDDDWMVVPFGANLCYSHFLSTGPCTGFDWYVEGLTPGGAELELTFERDSAICEDLVALTVLQVELTFDSVSEADEENPGGFLCLNDDDDNDDGTADKDDVGPTTGEDDLRALVIDVAGGLTEGTVELSITEGADKVTVYENPDRSSPVTLPDSWEVNELPVTLWVEGVETSLAPRDVQLKADYTSLDGSCADQVYLTVIQVDLDGDVDHDGDIDDADDALEHQLPGVITLCNVDDDDEDGNKDNQGPEANTIDDGPSANDHEDLAPIVLRGMPDLPVNWTVSLTLHSSTNGPPAVGDDGMVRVFSALMPGPDVAVILGPGSTSFDLPDSASHGVDLTSLRAGDLDLGVEGLKFAAEVMLRAALLDETLTVRSSDDIQLKVAPLILLGHLQSADRSFVSQVTCYGAGPESTAYCNTRFPDATPPGVTDDVIPTGLNGACDRWAQDEFQIGFAEAPYKSMYVLLDSKRDGYLDAFTNARAADGGLLGPDFGHVQIDDGTAANSLDSFGNLEVSPPCSSNGVDYPFGRIYYGDGGTGGRHMDPDLREFLERQKVQSPVTFDSDWLLVGHVDEFMSIVPNPYATHGWTVLLASPEYALDILDSNGVNPGVDPLLNIPRYEDHNIPPPPQPYYDYVVSNLGDLLARPLGLNTPVSGTSIREYNSDPVQPIMDSLKYDIMDAFGLEFSQDIADVPVLFNRDGVGAVAITPGLANGAVYGDVYIAPDQFLHQHDTGVPEEDTDLDFQLDTGEDLNTNGLLDTHRDPFHEALADDEVLPSGITANYIDDWQVYHLNEGEVHCSSNEQREIPVSPKWWETVP